MKSTSGSVSFSRRAEGCGVKTGGAIPISESVLLRWNKLIKHFLNGVEHLHQVWQLVAVWGCRSAGAMEKLLSVAHYSQRVILENILSFALSQIA